jgi:hypothetical protein
MGVRFDRTVGLAGPRGAARPDAWQTNTWTAGPGKSLFQSVQRSEPEDDVRYGGTDDRRCGWGFVVAMIPIVRGVVDMAKFQLQYG